MSWSGAEEEPPENVEEIFLEEDGEEEIEKYENMLYEDAVEFEILDPVKGQYEEVQVVEDEDVDMPEEFGEEKVEFVAIDDESGQELTAPSPEAPPFSPVTASFQSRKSRNGIDDHESDGSLHEPDAVEGVSPRELERGAAAARGRGRGGRGGCKRGVRLTEVYATDDEVPQYIRDNVVSLTNSRERIRKNEKSKVHMGNGESNDAGDEALFGGDESSLRFEWHPMGGFKGLKETFRPRKTGPTKLPRSAYDAFRQYWGDDILSYIVAETNRHAADLSRCSGPFAKTWHDTNIHEILILFAFWMMLGIIRMPSTKSCFTTHRLLQTQVFRTMFSRQRYEDICRALHFVDNSTINSESSRLFRIEHIIDHLNSHFQSAYVPKQEICIDESLMLWKGQLSFKQYAKTKAARTGIKTIELCESSTGYLWSFLVYTGKDTVQDDRFPPNLLNSTKTVLRLIWPLLDKGYTLFMGSWYNCPLLARFLKRHRTDCVGTLRPNRRNVPLLMTHSQNLKPGEFFARHSGDTVVMAYQSQRTTVFMISTYHGVEQHLTDLTPHVPAQCKPQVIMDYNKNMGGVDRKDQQLEPYLLERKRCAKWSMKLFKRLLNCSIQNSRILLQHSAAQIKEHIVFRLELVEQILDQHLDHVPRKRVSQGAQPKIYKNDDRPPSHRSKDTHWPRKAKGVTKANRTARRRCVWCTKNSQRQSRTTIECEACEVPLCLEPCFKLYHTAS